MQAHEVVGGVVINTIEINKVSSRPNLINATIPDANGNTGSIGDLWDGSIYSAPAAVVPEIVTRHQAMVALHRAGKMGEIKALLNNPGNEEASIAFDHKIQFERNSKFISSLAPSLGMSDADVDQLFIDAAAVE